MPPRRIAYVLKIFPKISETFIVSEMVELRRRGVKLRILSLEPPRKEMRHHLVAEAGLDQLTCYEPAKFLKVLTEFRPQLLHAHFATEATAMTIELATELDLPFTFTAHGYDIHRKAPPDIGPRAAAARAVVTVSQANARYLARTFGVDPAHIRVIPCGLDTETFRPAQLDHDGLIVCVARLVAVKNHGLLLEACSKLVQRGLNFRCVLVGDGPCRGELEAVRMRLGLQEFLEFAGPAEQSQVVDWWQRADIGVLSSHQEGMPVSLMEAAACGVPVVATAVGGVPELVEEGVTGLLVPPGDADGLAKALESVLQDGTLRERMGLAARRRAEDRFSVKHQGDQLLSLWSEILSNGGGAQVFVCDLCGAVNDSALPTLPLALNPTMAQRQLSRRLPLFAGPNGKARLKAIRVTRHKPGRRCVLEYDVWLGRPGLPAETITVMGKVRTRRFGKEGYRLLEQLWKAGFDSKSADGISVPEPVGVVPKFQMWFQRKVAGETATRLLSGPGGVELSRRIAEASYKLHQANIPSERRHNMADELRILHECLAKIIAIKPDWSARLERVLAACRRLGASVPEPRPCGIHRDFYPAQVIVQPEETSDAAPHSARSGEGGSWITSQSRIWLLDFDLYCLGDPALDIGNFIGHITEQALREKGNPFALAKQEEALAARFISFSGEQCRPTIDAYTTLTLVRHVYLSHQTPDRQRFALALLELCEQRLGL